MKRIRVEVKAVHIKRGKRGNAECCPVALALKACGMDKPYVAEDDIDDTEIQKSWPTPARVRSFIDKFDKGKPVKPFVFTLEAK